MRDGNSKKKFSWPKTLVKKWFNIKSKNEDFHADDIIYGGVDEEWRSNFSEREACTIKKSKTTEKSTRRNTDRARRSKIDLDASQITDVHNYRIFVATWNVAGKSPPSYLNLEEWLHTSPPADIYVLGFQEIVPLNAGNVLGTEDNGPARKWLALIRKTLNSLPGSSGSCRTPSPIPNPIVELDDDFEGSNREKASSFFHRRSFQSLSRSMRMMENDISMPQPRLDRRFSVCDRVIYGNRPSDYYDPNGRWDGSSDDENGPSYSPYAHYSPVSYNATLSLEERDRHPGQSSVLCWQRVDGLSWKQGITASIHLTSGEKDGDELRRNSDVMEILRKTRFPRVHGMGDENSPRTILEHDRIIWLGDLNYRIALSYRCAKALVEMRNWRALLENDQLRIQQRHGRVFAGWNEGRIYFPPTYKYSNNSDRYAGENMHPKEKRRTPAWCDRILWYGRGLQQLSYVRGESRFSDHRPVYSIFLAEVESINRSRIKKSMSYSSSRVEVEELLPYSQGYNQPNFY
ncbi:Type I inositol polyphosphate 5-phosphatase 4 [Sesamum angolense]|uniref:Type I inositol polyphosphate 5-phosphatase 4 n=1 Tax=Sesamum angolense TaxID=2727404 RepID=A0AAE1X8H5_9LAMI|nr:Type I inositol polyphosphate 5-phosphatase 4 [Sesamum angolense]